MSNTRNMQFELVHDIVIAAHTSSDPSMEEWQGYLKLSETHANAITGFFIYSHGGAPTATHRALGQALWTKIGRPPPPAAVIHNSAIIRHTVTALSFLGASAMKMFGPKEAFAVMEYLKIDASRRAETLYRLNQLVHQLGLNVSLFYK